VRLVSSLRAHARSSSRPPAFLPLRSGDVEWLHFISLSAAPPNGCACVLACRQPTCQPANEQLRSWPRSSAAVCSRSSWQALHSTWNQDASSMSALHLQFHTPTPASADNTGCTSHVRRFAYSVHPCSRVSVRGKKIPAFQDPETLFPVSACQSSIYRGARPLPTSGLDRDTFRTIATAVGRNLTTAAYHRSVVSSWWGSCWLLLQTRWRLAS
jgi:hypothetical protein